VSRYEASVQHLIDCDNTNKGCVDGWSTRTFKYVGNKGYVHWNKYPFQYLEAKRMCRGMYERDYIRFSYLRARQFLLMTPDNLKYHVEQQPVVVGINAANCVRNYKAGTISQNDCDCTSEDYLRVEVNYEAVVVGYGKFLPEDRESAYCDGYWLLRTSWGLNWGDRGHMKFCINKNRKQDDIGTCNVLVYPHYPEVLPE
jgi:Papain family cysteine protease